MQQCKLQEHQVKVAAEQTKTPSDTSAAADQDQHEPLVVPDTALGQVALVSTSGTVARAAEYNR